MRIPIALSVTLIAAGFGSVACGVMPAERSDFAELDGVKVRYIEAGSKSAPALVFVHGWSCDASFWARSGAALSDKFHTVRIDLPGHGESDKPHIAYTMDLYARAIDAVMQHAKIESAVLVAHSNGTPAIRQFYRKYPDKTRALVIVEGGLRPFGTREGMQKFVAQLNGPNYAEVFGGLIDNMTTPILDAALRQKIKTAMMQTPQYVGVSEFESTLDDALWKPDKINVPVLMVLAKQPLWSAEYEQFVRGLVPDLDYQVWDNVSHFLMMEQPERFNRALVAFLEKHKITS